MWTEVWDDLNYSSNQTAALFFGIYIVKNCHLQYLNWLSIRISWYITVLDPPPCWGAMVGLLSVHINKVNLLSNPSNRPVTVFTVCRRLLCIYWLVSSEKSVIWFPIISTREQFSNFCINTLIRITLRPFSFSFLLNSKSFKIDRRQKPTWQ